MSLSRVIVSNTLAQVISKAIAVIFGIITTALLTNYLGPAGFGDYLFVLSYVAIFTGIADWGTVLISVREASRRHDEQTSIFINTLVLRFLLSLGAMLLGILLIFILPLNSSNNLQLQKLVLLASSLTLLMGLKNSFGIIFQTKLQLDKTAMTEFLSSLITLILTVLTIRVGGNLFFLINAIILANLVTVLTALYFARQMTSLNFEVSWIMVKDLMVKALPMGGVLALFSIYNRLDTLLLQMLKGSTEVGVYGLAYRIYEVLILGAFYLTNSILPIMAAEKNSGVFKKFYQRILDLLILGGIGVGALTFIFSPLAIRLLSLSRAAQFEQSIFLLQILGLSLFFAYLNHLTGTTIVVLGEQKKYLLISLGALLFNLGTNLFFIPLYSFYAAAWITVGTEALVFLLTSLLIYQQTKILPNFLRFPKTALEIIKNKGKIF